MWWVQAGEIVWCIKVKHFLFFAIHWSQPPIRDFAHIFAEGEMDGYGHKRIQTHQSIIIECHHHTTPLSISFGHRAQPIADHQHQQAASPKTCFIIIILSNYKRLLILIILLISFFLFRFRAHMCENRLRHIFLSFSVGFAHVNFFFLYQFVCLDADGGFLFRRFFHCWILFAHFFFFFFGWNIFGSFISSFFSYFACWKISISPTKHINSTTKCRNRNRKHNRYYWNRATLR